MGYKARGAQQDAQCKKCENKAVYGIESSVSALMDMTGDTEEGKKRLVELQQKLNGYYCEDHIRKDMLGVIDAGDGGRELLDIIGYRDYSLEGKLDSLYFEYDEEDDCKCDCESKCCRGC